MQHFRAIFASLFVVVFLAGCAGMSGKPSPPLPAGTLTAQEVTALFTDRTVESILESNNRVSLTYYNPNGTLRQLQDGEKRDGVWRVRDDGRICLQFGVERERCRIIVMENQKYYKYIVKNDGQHIRVLSYGTFSAGNTVDK